MPLKWAGYKFTINEPVKERTHTVPLPAILHRGSTGMYQPCNDGKQNDRLRNLPQGACDLSRYGVSWMLHTLDPEQFAKRDFIMDLCHLSRSPHLVNATIINNIFNIRWLSINPRYELKLAVSNLTRMKCCRGILAGKLCYRGSPALLLKGQR